MLPCLVKINRCTTLQLLFYLIRTIYLRFNFIFSNTPFHVSRFVRLLLDESVAILHRSLWGSRSEHVTSVFASDALTHPYKEAEHRAGIGAASPPPLVAPHFLCHWRSGLLSEMAAFLRARKYVRCVVRFSDREL